MRIGELSTRTGASIRSLRYYEEQLLLAPQRSASGQRIFSEGAVVRVRQIRRLLDAGLGIVRIRDLLPCIEAAPSDRTGHLHERLVDERNQLDTKIESLRATRETLDHLITDVT